MPTHDPALARLIAQVEQALQSRSPLEIRGGGTKLFYGGAAVGRLLDLRELRGISRAQAKPIWPSLRNAVRTVSFEMTPSPSTSGM